MKKSKGFTLIELLVVVAIIGILATVVLASLGTARARAKDSAAKAALSQLRAEMELEALSSATGYNAAATGTACLSAADKFITDAGNQAGAALCNASASGDAYAASVTLNDGTFFCVDSTGFAGAGSAVLGTATVCS